MWRQAAFSVILLAMITTASATTVTNEEVEVDLTDSTVHVDMEVGELTTRNFTYFTTYEISNVDVKSDGEDLDCRVRSSNIESEISCAVNKSTNFTTDLNFTADGLVTSEGNRNVFDYTQNFPRPTNKYSLTVILPRGEVLVDQDNVTQSVINPPNGDISTNGQRISVTWNVNPPEGETSILGETRSFRVLYESVEEDQNSILMPAVTVIAILALLTAIVLGAREFLRKSIDDEYENLSEDEIDLIELLKENEGKMLQKDIVEKMDYSKAKVSGIVKELVEGDILEKKKEGRSNMLKISKKYRY